MRRIAVFALMINLLIFSGCGSSADCGTKFAEFREKLLASEEICFVASVDARTDDGVEQYRLKCTYSGGEYTVEVIEPERISGVKAVITDGSLQLECDGVIMDTGMPETSEITPVSALPTVAEAMLSGYAELCWSEGDGDSRCIAVQMALTESSRLIVRLGQDGTTPVSAEIYEDRVLTVSVEIESWTM